MGLKGWCRSGLTWRLDPAGDGKATVRTRRGYEGRTASRRLQPPRLLSPAAQFGIGGRVTVKPESVIARSEATRRSRGRRDCGSRLGSPRHLSKPRPIGAPPPKGGPHDDEAGARPKMDKPLGDERAAEPMSALGEGGHRGSDRCRARSSGFRSSSALSPIFSLAQNPS
jgi:hypothetical protein